MMAAEIIDIEEVSLKSELETEDGEVQNLSQAILCGTAIKTEDFDVEEFDTKRIYIGIEPTSLLCSTQEKDTIQLPKVISENDFKKPRRFRQPFRLLECPQCDKIYKRSYVSRLTKHVMDRHRMSSKELLCIIYETYGLLCV